MVPGQSPLHASRTTPADDAPALANYAITADRRRERVRIRISGFFSVAKVEAFSRDEQAAARSLALGSGAFDLLIETPEGTTQSPEVVAAFQHIADHSPLKARRIAIVSHSTLLRLQLRRIARGRTGIFGSTSDAEAWLDEMRG